MGESFQATLAEWADFYLITGGAAAALIGLMFVAQTLMTATESRLVRSEPEAGISAYSAPTVTHLLLTLVLSALMCVPWGGWMGLHVVLVVTGASALVYTGIVMRRTLRLPTYHPVLEDWLFHIVFPTAAYLALLGAAFFVGASPTPLFVVGAATLLLLAVGVHNAWDLVTFLTIATIKTSAKDRSGPGAGPPAP